MLPKDFWDIYVGGFAPLDFMRLFNSSDTRACAWAYVKERPALYGIVRRGSWHDTFAAKQQYTRAEVHAGLSAYLEETEPEWREVLQRELDERRNASAPEESEAPREAARPFDCEAGGDELAPEAPQDAAPPPEEIDQGGGR